jgi:hypothetical protein
MDKGTKNEKTVYPMLGVKNWHALRAACQKKLPEVIDPDFLSKTLGMAKRSAANNVLPYLKSTGLTDADGKPTELGKRWIDDKEYAKVCEEIRLSIYPQELIKAFADPTKSKAEVRKWFLDNAGVGEGAAGRISAFYTMLAGPDLTAQKKKPGRAPAKKTAKKKAVKPAAKAGAAVTKKAAAKKPGPKKKTAAKNEAAPVKPVEPDKTEMPKAKAKPSAAKPEDKAALKKAAGRKPKPRRKVRAAAKAPAKQTQKAPIAKAVQPKRKPRKSQAVYDIPGPVFNIQITLSDKTTPQQIDKIFASIAKHLKDGGAKTKG